MNQKSSIRRALRPARYIFYFCSGLASVFYLLLKKKNDEIFLILTGSIGDDVYGMSYVHALKNKTKKNLVVYCRDSRTKLVENYEVADEIRGLTKYCTYINQIKIIMDYARHLGIYTILPDYYIPMENNGKRSCLDIMRNNMLRVGDDTTIQYPDFKDEPIESIPNIEETGNNTIIFNYSSSSMPQIDISLFQTIADELLENGYQLYTNVIGDQKPLNGTKPLNCSIYELFAICNQVKALISIRSGILDICANTKTPFLVYNFPFIGRSKTYNEGWCNRYSLKAWGKDNLIECFVDNNVDPMQYFQKFKEKYLN